jgi:hypothetical protein
MKTIVYSEPGDTVLLEADGHPITCHRNDMVGDSMFFYFQPRATTFVLRQADSVESVVMETTLYIRIAWHLKLLEATCQLWLIPLLVITFSLKLLLREVFMRPNQALDKVVLGQQQLIASHICFFFQYTSSNSKPQKPSDGTSATCNDRHFFSHPKTARS